MSCDFLRFTVRLAMLGQLQLAMNSAREGERAVQSFCGTALFAEKSERAKP